MNTPAHPDPERLAAFAGTDPEALADRGLVAHVAECAICERDVRELAALRTALAELPDLVPSRPLLLVPPVPEPDAAGGWRVGLRRIFAPVAVAGLVLLLVGSFGASGALGPASPGAFFQQFSSASGPGGAEAPAEYGTDASRQPYPLATGGNDSGYESPRENDGSGVMSASEKPAVQPPAAEGSGQVSSPEVSRDLADESLGGRAGWVAIALLGGGLLAAALVVRRATVVG